MSKVYEIITEKIVKELESGKCPWRKPWNDSGAPINAISKKEYRGINVFLLGITSAARGYTSPFWITFKQCSEAGGSIKSGEKGTMVVFFKMYKREESEEKCVFPVLRYYVVFNTDQCEGLKIELPKAEQIAFNPIEAAEKIASGYHLAPRIIEGGNSAFYMPSTDEIGMPKKESFRGVPEYYSTLFHELTHSTGHERRLKREGVVGHNAFGSNEYSKEELIAEMGAAFLCGFAGIENNTIENSAAYLRGWASRLRSNKTWIVCAASAAQKAVDYIRGIDRKEKTDGESR